CVEYYQSQRLLAVVGGLRLVPALASAGLCACPRLSLLAQGSMKEICLFGVGEICLNFSNTVAFFYGFSGLCHKYADSTIKGKGYISLLSKKRLHGTFISTNVIDLPSRKERKNHK